MPDRLRPFGERIWYIDGPDVLFYSIPLATRSVVVRLTDNTVWIWSPIADLDDELADEIERKVGGPVAHLVSPNKIHWLYLKVWQERYPQARVYASPGLTNRKVVAAQGIRFDATLSDNNSSNSNDADDVPDDPLYAADIDQMIFTTGGYFDEVVFFHRPSKTLIVCDLIQRNPERPQLGYKEWLLKRAGVVGERGTCPGDLRCLFAMTGSLPSARRNLDKILNEWQPQKLIVAHGSNVESNAFPVIADAFRWIPESPRSGPSCCMPKATDECELCL